MNNNNNSFNNESNSNKRRKITPSNSNNNNFNNSSFDRVAFVRRYQSERAITIPLNRIPFYIRIVQSELVVYTRTEIYTLIFAILIKTYIRIFLASVAIISYYFRKIIGIQNSV